MRKTTRLGVTRLATAQTTKERKTRILKTRRIPFTGDPATLIRLATQLLPQRRPRNLMLYISRRDTDGELPVLEISFGVNKRGEGVHVKIRLENSDLPMMQHYLARCGAVLWGAMACAYPTATTAAKNCLSRASVLPSSRSSRRRRCSNDRARDSRFRARQVSPHAGRRFGVGRSPAPRAVL